MFCLDVKEKYIMIILHQIDKFQVKLRWWLKFCMKHA